MNSLRQSQPVALSSRLSAASTKRTITHTSAFRALEHPYLSHGGERVSQERSASVAEGRRQGACLPRSISALNRHRRDTAVCRAAAGAPAGMPPARTGFPERGLKERDHAEEGDRSLLEVLLLSVLFSAWYATNIMFNIFNKELFSIFRYPLTTTLIQFFIGSCISLTFWATGFVKRPQFELSFVKNVAPLALIHVMGNVLTNISLGLVAVSFTHTVKAAEPFFSAMFSYLFMGDLPPLPVLLTLVPIVAGVVIASASEASFNWGGFLSAIASNITFQSRNVLSKKLMISSGNIDKVSMFQLLTVMAFFMLLPVAIVVEGMPALPSALIAAGLNSITIDKIYHQLFFAGLCFHGYQQLSYLVLSRMSPVSHSVGNSCKRVAVIVASLIWFRNPISTQNALGTALALTGVFLYSQAKRMFSKKGAKGVSASD